MIKNARRAGEPADISTAMYVVMGRPVELLSRLLSTWSRLCISEI